MTWNIGKLNSQLQDDMFRPMHNHKRIAFCRTQVKQPLECDFMHRIQTPGLEWKKTLNGVLEWTLKLEWTKHPS